MYQLYNVPQFYDGFMYWGSIHEKVKQQRGWVEKSVAYKKSV